MTDGGAQRLSNWAVALIIVLALCVVALIGYARGNPHHRGEDVTYDGVKVIVIQRQ